MARAAKAAGGVFHQVSARADGFLTRGPRGGGATPTPWTPTVAPSPHIRSPASMAAVIVFAGGASGHNQELS
jgi:hypothetical protein